LLQDSPAVNSSSMNLPQQGPQTGPRFCCRHDSSEKRPKQEEASFKGCRKCQMQLHTNHRELALCPGCSESENRCMICAASAAPEPRLAATPVRSMVLNSRPSPGASPGGGQPPLASRGLSDVGGLAPGPPKYCFRHCTSDKRPKVESRIQECVACRTRIHTNLAEFALCAACCEKEQRCMVCGNSAEAIPPMPGIGASPELGKASSLSMQPRFGQGLKGGLLGSPGAQPSAVAPALSGPGLPAPPQFQSRR